jgi:putative two-component system response regulator
MMTARLLLIDDVPDNLEFMAILLRDNYDVFSFGSPGEAIVRFREIRPDLLVLDVRMFPINGVDFLKHVRAIKGFRDIPALAVTALAYEAEKQAFIDAGFHAVVTKPIVDLQQFELVIESLLKRVESVNDSFSACYDKRAS